jgi:glycosyltransferase involved in cell wall biosynthesis
MRQDVLVADGVGGVAGLITCLFCRLLGKKSIITIHGHFDREWLMHSHSKLQTLFFRTCRRVVLSWADLLVVNDCEIGQHLVASGIERSRVFTRYVFVDTEKFCRGRVGAGAGDEPGGLRSLPDRYVLYVGALDRWDGADDILKVFKRIHDQVPTAKCVLVGDGPLKPWVASFVADNNLVGSVLQLDWVEHDMMPRIYYGADLVMLPNRPPQGGIGRIALEALSMEVPVIAYDVGEVRKVVRDGETGYVVPEGDTELMATRAVFLLGDPEMRRKLGASGRQLVRSAYDVDTYIGNWLDSLRYVATRTVTKKT